MEEDEIVEWQEMYKKVCAMDIDKIKEKVVFFRDPNYGGQPYFFPSDDPLWMGLDPFLAWYFPYRFSKRSNSARE